MQHKLSLYSPVMTEIMQSILKIPPMTSYLELNWFNKRVAELVQIMTAIPASVISLYLVNNSLGQMTGAELAQILASIPATVGSLQLNRNCFKNMSFVEFMQVLAAIPPTITALNLSSIGLWQMTGAELAQIFGSIPATITSLSLLKNKLNKMNAVELAQALAAIPSTITSLDLTHNGFGKMPGNELSHVFGSIPPTVTSLYLRDNNLGLLTSDIFVQVLTSIHPTITTLDLSFNNFDYKEMGELVQVWAAIPITTTTFSWSGNDLYNLRMKELIHALEALPTTLTSLNLDYNYLGYMDIEELAQVLEAIPLTITSLDLSSNHFKQKKTDHLAYALSFIPPTVISLNLSYIFIFHDARMDTELPAILYNLPYNVEIVLLENQTVYRDSFIVNSLINQVSSLLLSKNYKGLAFDSISLPVEIDEACLCRIVSDLDLQITPMDHLICGLLLEGHIPTTTDKIVNSLEYEQFMEKRTQDAISFYTKAAVHPDIKPLAEFLLWELKQTSNLPSVIKRLAEYDLSPTYAVNMVNVCNQAQREVKVALLNELGLFGNSESNLKQQSTFSPQFKF